MAAAAPSRRRPAAASWASMAACARSRRTCCVSTALACAQGGGAGASAFLLASSCLACAAYATCSSAWLSWPGRATWGPHICESAVSPTSRRAARISVSLSRPPRCRLLYSARAFLPTGTAPQGLALPHVARGVAHLRIRSSSTLVKSHPAAMTRTRQSPHHAPSCVGQACAGHTMRRHIAHARASCWPLSRPSHLPEAQSPANVRCAMQPVQAPCNPQPLCSHTPHRSQHSGS